MLVRDGGVGRSFVSWLDFSSDLLEGVAAAAGSADITCGVFSAIGALSSAQISFYDQSAHVYLNRLAEEPVELVSCLGNKSSKDGRSSVHPHVALADRQYRVWGGHLVKGSVFAAEVHLQSLGEAHLVREPDFISHRTPPVVGAEVRSAIWWQAKPRGQASGLMGRPPFFSGGLRREGLIGR